MKLWLPVLLVLAATPAACAEPTAKPADKAKPAAAAAAAAAKPAAAATAQMRAGNYECWANGSVRMGMNFSVTGPGAYKNESGPGKFTVGADGTLKLTGPMLESMPDGFTAVYYAPGGIPTVSFRGPSGEAAFCEHVGK